MGHLCVGPARSHQSRHPPAPGAAPAARPTPDRADERPAPVNARHAGHLLRRRDRHGRQHPSRRPRRRAHADAMVGGPQWRILARRSGRASSFRPSWIRSTVSRRSMWRRRSRDPHSLLNWMRRMLPAAPQPHRVRPRHVALPLSGQPARPRLSARARGRDHPVRRQSGAHAAGGRARPVGLRRPRAGGDDGAVGLSADRPAHLSPDACRPTASTGSS